MVLFCLITTIVSCLQIDQAGFGDVSVKSVDSILRASDKAIVVDVRTPEEYITGHIKGAILIDYYSASFQTQIQRLPKDKPIIVYCRSGKRGQQAREILTSLGYSRVNNMLGGILAWTKSRFPLITGAP